VDDRLVAPESHAQVVDGVLLRTMGANPPHATRHFAVAHVFAGALADGYDGAVDMLTRTDEDNDLAPDVSIFPVGIDPATGGRRLEEIAFEVLDTERLSHATGKAEKLVARGVRRVFCVRIADRTVYEWNHDAEGWTTLEPMSAAPKKGTPPTSRAHQAESGKRRTRPDSSHGSMEKMPAKNSTPGRVPVACWPWRQTYSRPSGPVVAPLARLGQRHSVVTSRVGMLTAFISP